MPIQSLLKKRHLLAVKSNDRRSVISGEPSAHSCSLHRCGAEDHLEGGEYNEELIAGAHVKTCYV